MVTLVLLSYIPNRKLITDGEDQNRTNFDYVQRPLTECDRTNIIKCVRQNEYAGLK